MKLQLYRGWISYKIITISISSNVIGALNDDNDDDKKEEREEDREENSVLRKLFCLGI